MSLNKHSYILSLINSILLEDVNQSNVIDAIKKKYEVVIDYDNGARGPRTIQPVVYGKTTSGNLAIRAYQTNGPSSEGEQHGWKMFRLDKIAQWNPQKGKTFSEPPEYKEDGLMNKGGDEKMSEIYIMADFGNGNTSEPVTNTHSEINAQPIQPQAKEPQQKDSGISGIDKERGQSKNISVTDMSKSKGFGDEKGIAQTVGPVLKNNTEQEVEIGKNTPNYNSISDQGPKYKNSEENNDNGEDKESIFDTMDFADDEDIEQENGY